MAGITMSGKGDAQSANYEVRPGMNDAMRKKDSQAWEVTAEDVQGPGRFMSLNESYGGPVVGSPYDASPMGEDRERITWPEGKKQ